MDGEEIGQPPPPPPREESGAGSKAESLSIEETNKLRASLGLKPLKVDEPKKVAAGEEGKGGEVELVCSYVCVEGCFCKEGHVRNEKTGECVLPEQCPGIYLPEYYT